MPSETLDFKPQDFEIDATVSMSFKHNQNSVCKASLGVAEVISTACDGLRTSWYYNNLISKANKLLEDPTPSDILKAILEPFYCPEEVESHTAALLRTFGSLANIIKTPSNDLLLVTPLSTAALFMISTVHFALTHVLREPISERPIIGSSKAVHDYLRFTMAGSEREIIRILFLTAKHELLRDEVHSTGTVTHAMVYPREILKRVLQLNASGLIIVHNHPSGNPCPSADDIKYTASLMHILKSIDVKLLDHVIVGEGYCVSFSDLGLL